jgi:Flp pilus assembly protein TadG
MILRRADKTRKGATAVEGAVVYPSFFALLFMLVVGGMGVFHYQMCACLANEAVRFACVRGKSWAKETGATSPTQQQIFDQCVAPAAVGMNLTNLSVALVVVDPASGTSANWDSSPKFTYTVSSTGTAQTTRVRATVSYNWFPELFLVGPYTMSAVAEQPMEF